MYVTLATNWSSTSYRYWQLQRCFWVGMFSTFVALEICRWKLFPKACISKVRLGEGNELVWRKCEYWSAILIRDLKQRERWRPGHGPLGNQMPYVLFATHHESENVCFDVCSLIWCPHNALKEKNRASGRHRTRPGRPRVRYLRCLQPCICKVTVSLVYVINLSKQISLTKISCRALVGKKKVHHNQWDTNMTKSC